MKKLKINEDIKDSIKYGLYGAAAIGLLAISGVDAVYRSNLQTEISRAQIATIEEYKASDNFAEIFNEDIEESLSQNGAVTINTINLVNEKINKVEDYARLDADYAKELNALDKDAKDASSDKGIDMFVMALSAIGTVAAGKATVDSVKHYLKDKNKEQDKDLDMGE